jgi:hypothetical protein
MAAADKNLTKRCSGHPKFDKVNIGKSKSTFAQATLHQVGYQSELHRVELQIE